MYIDPFPQTPLACHSTPTIDVYDRIAADYVTRTLSADMSSLYNTIAALFPRGARLLDIGSGSGRDALALTARGYAVDILEPSQGLLSDFIARAPDFPGQCFHSVIGEAALPRASYDGIYACASLLHVPPEQWSADLHALRASMKQGGRLYISVKQGDSGYDAEGRWFTGFASLTALRSVVELTGGGWTMVSENTKNDALGRTTIWLDSWFQAV